MSAHIDKVNICIERLKALADRLDEAGFEADNPAHQAGFWMEREAIEVLLAYVSKLRGQVEGLPCPSCARLKAENERLRGVLESRHGGEPFALLDELDAARERAEAMRDVCEAAADCDPSFLTASLRAAISRLAQTKEGEAQCGDCGAEVAAGKKFCKGCDPAVPEVPETILGEAQTKEGK